MATLKKYLYGIVGLIVGLLLAFFLCHEFNLNPFNDSDDTHVLEFHTSTSYRIEERSVELAPAKKDIVKGQPLTDSDKAEIFTHRSHYASRQRSNANGLSERDTAGVDRKIDVSPCPDLSFKVNDSLDWTTAEWITIDDTSFVHRDTGKYYLKMIVDCMYGALFDVRISSSPLSVVTVTKHQTDVVTKRPWLRLSPFVGTNALNTSEWFAGINLSIRYGEFWLRGGAELPMRKDMGLNVPVGLEYDLITLER